MINDQTKTPMSLSRLLALLGIGGAALSSLLGLLCFLFFYDPAIGYFKRGAFLPILTEILVAALVVAFAVLAFLLRKHTATLPKEPHVNASAAMACALLFVLYVPAAFLMFDLMPLISAWRDPFLPAAIRTTLTRTVVLHLLGVISAVGSAVYFVMIGLRRHSSARPYLGLGPILWLLCAVAISYFDFYLQMNAPEKLFLHFAALALMLAMVSELKLPVVAHVRALDLFFHAAALLLSAFYAFPVVLCALFGTLSSPSYLPYPCVMLALAPYFGSRLLSLTRVMPKEAEPKEQVKEEIQKNEAAEVAPQDPIEEER